MRPRGHSTVPHNSDRREDRTLSRKSDELERIAADLAERAQELREGIAAQERYAEHLDELLRSARLAGINMTHELHATEAYIHDIQRQQAGAKPTFPEICIRERL